MSQTLEVKLFNRTSFCLDQRFLNAPSSTLVQTLLAYLVLHPQVAHTRTKLATLLWPEKAQTEALASLRRLLYRIRKTLPELDQLVEAKRSTVQWYFSGTLELDVEAFNQAVQSAAAANADPSAARQYLEQAAQLYGEFLPDCEDEWAIATRAKLQQTCIQALISLIQLLETQQEYDTAIHYAQKLLTIAPLREATYCILMRLHAQQGDLNAVHQVYQQCEAVLQEQLGLDPSAATQQLLKDLQQQTPADSTDSEQQESNIDSESIDTTPRSSWGNAPDVSLFYGRTEELKTLKHWVTQERCRLLAILGMGGIGKTALAVKLGLALENAQKADKASEQSSDVIFQAVVWRSLRNAPPLETLMAELVPILSNQQDTEATPSRLLHWLRQSPCLVILDNGETILQSGERAGQFRAGYENYTELFQLVGETQHQSCLIVTSREKPAQIAIAEGVGVTVRSLSLDGSQEAAQAILKAKGMMGTSEQQQQLCELYSHNPLALQIVASSIQDLFDGAIEVFLEQDTVFFSDVRRLLDQQFDRLSELEQSVMYWLAINRDGTEVAELAEDIIPNVDRIKLLESLESLMWRSLIEKQSQNYTQQPVVMEYVIDRLINRVNDELAADFLRTEQTSHPLFCLRPKSLFNTHALLKTTVKDYIRKSQQRLILTPIAEMLRAKYGQFETFAQSIRRNLKLLSNDSALASGYSGGNLLNLCCYLQVDLTSYKFSGLVIRHPYLQDACLHQVDFTGSKFVKAAFTQAFGHIMSVTVSPNGQLLATGDTNHHVRIWRLADGQPLFTCESHTDWVRSLVFSADGQTLISGCDDQTIRLWDTKTGRLLKLLDGHPSRVASLAISADNATIVSSSEDGTVRLWDVETGQCVRALEGHSQQVWCVALSAEGAIASGSEDHTVRLWDITTGQCLHVLKEHSNWIQTVAFSPDGQYLASGSHDHMIKLWDVRTGECLQTLLGHSHWIWSVAFHPNRKLLATASEDLTIRLWDLETGQCLKSFKGHTNRIWAITFNPKGDLLVSGSDDLTIRLWDVHRGQCLKTLQGYKKNVYSVVYSPDGQTLASSGDEAIIRIWAADSGECLRTIGEPSRRIENIAFSPDGRFLVSGGEDQVAKLWDVQTGQCVRALTGHTKQIWAVAYSPDGERVASSGEGGRVRLWNVVDGQCINVSEHHTNWIVRLVFSPDGRYLASGSFDQTIGIWDATTGQYIRTLQGHSNSVTGTAFSPDSSLLASTSYDLTVKIWDVRTGDCLKTLLGHPDIPFFVGFSPSGQMIASGCKIIKLWDISTGDCLNTLAEKHTDLIFALAFSPDGKTLASGGDETINLWDVETGDYLKTLRVKHPYEGMNVTNVTGITDAQKASLKILGAVVQH